MTNYEKLCEAAGIKERCGCYNEYIDEASMPCDTPCEECSYYAKKQPDFTAKKQIELIKLLMITGDFMGFKEKTKPKFYVLCFKMSKNQLGTDFPEALAGLALQLIEAGELDKDEERRILE